MRRCWPAAFRVMPRAGTTAVSAGRSGPICDYRHGADAGAEFLSFRLADDGMNCRPERDAGVQPEALRTKRANIVSQECNISFRARAVTKPATVSNRLATCDISAFTPCNSI